MVMRNVNSFSKTVMKRFFALLLITVIALLSFLIAAPIVNDKIARATAAELVNLPLPENTEYVEHVWQAGKLVGNGNGMQYFGAILIKSDLSLEELNAYYSDIAKSEWDCTVEKQDGADIRVLENAELKFQTDIHENNYYIVYAWGNDDTIFREFDIRGH